MDSNEIKTSNNNWKWLRDEKVAADSTVCGICGKPLNCYNTLVEKDKKYMRVHPHCHKAKILCMGEN